MEHEKTSHDFFNAGFNNTVFEKFREVAATVPQAESLVIVENGFRMSGYKRIREQVAKVAKIKILVGIDTAEIFRFHNSNLFLMGGKKTEKQAKAIYAKEFIRDVGQSAYGFEQETSIEELCEDIRSGLVELRINTLNDLKTNVYMLNYRDSKYYYDPCHLITGTGSLSETGAGSPKFAINLYSNDIQSATFHREEFEKIWSQSLPVTLENIESFKAATHLGGTPTPHDLYMKVLMDFFGSQVGSSFSFALPEEFKELKYQVDAVNQGYEMLMRHNGFFLADVVGLGKTVVAAMLAKRFIQANDERLTKILVVYPPSVADNWQSTFQSFGLSRNAHFISIGSLDKLFDADSKYLNIEDYCMVLLDESHRARNDDTDFFGMLERLCKSGRKNIYNVKGLRKKIALISATPLNNSPEDLYNQLRLFQDVRNSTINGIANLQKYFAPKISEYKRIMKNRGSNEESAKSIVEQVNALYDSIRREVLDQVTVRRTRQNLMNNAEYKSDLEKQGITFPKIERPREVDYTLGGELKNLFGDTIDILTERLHYARYKAIERLTGDNRNRYLKAEKISRALGVLYRTHMVKRLESSFEAFRLSLGRLLYATEVMINMFERDKVIIAPDLKINKLRAEGYSFEEIIEEGAIKFGSKEDEFVYPASAFDPAFLQELYADAEMLRGLITAWEGVDYDPKLDKLLSLMQDTFFDTTINPTGKLVIFSESKDTILYLEKALKEALQRTDILAVSSENRAKLQITVQENFDANYRSKKNDYNIIISTDTLSEGVNLHRSNVIASYDTPWNATRLMQRNGRVNRIGSVADSIFNYLFYPSAEGDAQINLYQNALAKLQGFHAALGEDSQIYSLEEVVQQFELFNPNVGDDEDKRMGFLSELREFYNDHPEEYERIKNLPLKSRLNRIAELNFHKGVAARTSLVYVSSSYKSSYYKVFEDQVNELAFLDAALLFKAPKEEEIAPYKFKKEHFGQVGKAFDHYNYDVSQYVNTTATGYRDKDNRSASAIRYLRRVWRTLIENELRSKIDTLTEYLDMGIYAQLAGDVIKLSNKYHDTDKEIAVLPAEIEKLYDKYFTDLDDDSEYVEHNYGTPEIILSQTFV